MKKRLILVTVILCLFNHYELFHFVRSTLYSIDKTIVKSKLEKQIEIKTQYLAKKENYDVIYIGDSILKQLHQSLPKSANSSTADIIVPGLSVDLLTNILIPNVRTEKLIIMLGINDVGLGTNKEIFIDYLNKVVSKFKAKKVIVLELLPHSKWTRNYRLSSSYNEAIRSLRYSVVNLGSYINVDEDLVDGLHLNTSTALRLSGQLQAFITKDSD